MHAKVLRQQLLRLREQASNGNYSEDDLEALSAILMAIRLRLRVKDEVLARAAGVSTSTVRDVYMGRRHPRYQNFMALIGGAIQVCDLSRGRVRADDAWVSTRSSNWSDPWLAQWLHNKTRQEQISLVVIALESLISALRGSNATADMRVVDDIERKQLIAILETALVLLKSPLVEVGFFRKLADQLKRIAVKSVSREVESVVGSAAEQGRREILKYISDLLN